MSAIALNVAPIFILILVGWTLARTGFLKASVGDGLGEFVFKVAVPMLMFRTLLETTLQEYERVLKVNLVGEFLGIKAVAPGMVERGRGSIINISSVDGMKGANGLAAYASSKWGVRGLTKVAAMELGHRGVRVNSVHPGGVDTVMGNPGQRSRNEVNQGFTNIALQRVGEPHEVAAATLFLASDESSYMVGAEIVVDGGMTAGHYYQGLPGAPGV